MVLGNGSVFAGHPKRPVLLFYCGSKFSKTYIRQFISLKLLLGLKKTFDRSEIFGLKLWSVWKLYRLPMRNVQNCWCLFQIPDFIYLLLLLYYLFYLLIYWDTQYTKVESFKKNLFLVYGNRISRQRCDDFTSWNLHWCASSDNFYISYFFLVCRFQAVKNNSINQLKQWTSSLAGSLF